MGTITMAGTDSQFAKGHSVPVSHQSAPGKQHEMAGKDPVNDQLPTSDGGYQSYLAANKLKGKRALITGGDSGIGRAVAILYATEGAQSTIVYMDEEEKDAQETKRLVEEAVKGMGGVDTLVLNHGFQMMKETIGELSEEQWVKTFDTNIHPFFYLSKYTLPHMSPGSTIITCASVNHYIGRPDLIDYTSTKGAIVAFTRALSNQQIENGIRVNAVCPGPIWTPLIPATMNEKAQKEFTSPMGRPGQPSEVATCFVFLASADSSFISGQSLHPNGGVIVGS